MKNKKKQIKKKLQKKESVIEPENPVFPDVSKEILFNLIADLISIISPDGLFTKLNDSWERLLEMPRQEIMALPYLAFVHPEDVQLMVSEVEKVPAGSETVEFISRFRMKKGSYKWLQWHLQAYGKNGEILALARDISGLKESEIGLLKRDQISSTFLKDFPFPLLSADSEGNIIRSNTGCLELLGFSGEEFTGKCFHDFVIPEDRGKTEGCFLKMKGGEKAILETVLTRKDGSVVSVQFNGVPIPDPDNSGTILQIILQDLSERNRSIGAVLDNEERLRAILEGGSDSVLVLDNAGKILFSNSRFTGIWGIPGEMLGIGEEENLLSFVVKRLQELKMIHKKVKDLSHGEKEEIDFIEFKDGRIFELRVFPLILDNKIDGRVLFMRDRTEQVRKENILLESETKFRLLSDLSPYMIFISRNEFIEYVNAKAEDITGISTSASYRMNLRDYLSPAPENQNLLEEKLEMLLSGEAVDPFEYILINRKGSKVHTLFSLKAVFTGKEKLVVGFLSDITFLKRSEKEAIQKSESLESYYKFVVGRENKMVDLKKEVNKLLLLLGEDEKYKIVG